MNKEEEVDVETIDGCRFLPRQAYNKQSRLISNVSKFGFASDWQNGSVLRRYGTVEADMVQRRGINLYLRLLSTTARLAQHNYNKT